MSITPRNYFQHNPSSNWFLLVSIILVSPAFTQWYINVFFCFEKASIKGLVSLHSLLVWVPNVRSEICLGILEGKFHWVAAMGKSRIESWVPAKVQRQGVRSEGRLGKLWRLPKRCATFSAGLGEISNTGPMVVPKRTAPEDKRRVSSFLDAV